MGSLLYSSTVSGRPSSILLALLLSLSNWRTPHHGNTQRHGTILLASAQALQIVRDAPQSFLDCVHKLITVNGDQRDGFLDRRTEYPPFLNLLANGTLINANHPLVQGWFDDILTEVQLFSPCRARLCTNLPVGDIYSSNTTWTESENLSAICQLTEKVWKNLDTIIQKNETHVPVEETDRSSNSSSGYFLILLSIVVVVVYLVIRYGYCKHRHEASKDRTRSSDDDEDILAGDHDGWEEEEDPMHETTLETWNGPPRLPDSAKQVLALDDDVVVYEGLAGYALFRQVDDDKLKKHYFQGRACLGISNSRIIGYADDKLLMHVEWDNAEQVGLDVINDNLLSLKFQALRDGVFCGQVEYRFELSDAVHLCERLQTLVMAYRFHQSVAM